MDENENVMTKVACVAFISTLVSGTETNALYCYENGVTYWYKSDDSIIRDYERDCYVVKVKEGTWFDYKDNNLITIYKSGEYYVIFDYFLQDYIYAKISNKNINITYKGEYINFIIT